MKKLVLFVFGFFLINSMAFSCDFKHFIGAEEFLAQRQITVWKRVSDLDGYDGLQQKGMYILGSEPKYFGKVILEDEQYEAENRTFSLLQDRIIEDEDLKNVLVVPIKEMKSNHCGKDQYGKYYSFTLQIMPFAGPITLDRFICKNILSDSILIKDYKYDSDPILKESYRDLFFEIMERVGRGFGLLYKHGIRAKDTNGNFCNRDSLRLSDDGETFYFVDCGAFHIDPIFPLDFIRYFTSDEGKDGDFALTRMIYSRFKRLEGTLSGFYQDPDFEDYHLYGFQIEEKKGKDEELDHTLWTPNLEGLSALYGKDERNIPVSYQISQLVSWTPWLKHLFLGFMRSAQGETKKHILECLRDRHTSEFYFLYDYKVHQLSKIDPGLWTSVFMWQSIQDCIDALREL